MTPHSENMVEMQKRFFVVSILVDGVVAAAVTVPAYTEDMAIIRALVPQVLVRLGLVDPLSDQVGPLEPVDYNTILDEHERAAGELP